MADKKNLEPSIRQQAEDRVATQNVQLSKPLHTLTLDEIENVIHELEVHQIELEIQNEELLATQEALERSKKRYFDLYDMAPVGYCTINKEGLILEANLASSNLFGVDRKKLIKQPITHFILKEDQDLYYLYRKKFYGSETQHSCELRMVKSNGVEFWAHLSGTCEKNTNDTPVFRLVLNDISERKRAEEELSIAAITFQSQNGILITDPESIIIRVNPAFTQLTGYSAEDAIGQTLNLITSGRHGPLFYQGMWDSIKKEGRWQDEIWNKRKNGQIYPALITITAIYSSKGEVTHYIGNFSDITKEKEAEAKIHRLAYYDPLTNLPNRRLFQDRLQEAIIATSRSGQYGAIFFIDLDNFKGLNDTKGHGSGDLLLVQIAQRLRESIRQKDTVARLGGDEFVVLLENLGTDKHEAIVIVKQISQKLFKETKRPFILDGYEYYCNLSMGVCFFDKDSTTEDLFKHADIAMYQAKNAGHNMLYFYDPPVMEEVLELHNEMETEFREALKRNQLHIYYQPQVDVARRVIGAEALLRWEHPEYGLIAPDDFIPMAEYTGLIVPIGLWVLETACALIKTWEDDVITREMQLAVNISYCQFRQSDFVTQLQRILKESDINPARLKLELTESLVLKDIKKNIEIIQAIKHLGVSFSMDDFGTGYSSLSYLTQLPFTEIKIDKSFICNLPGKKSDENIVRAIITMGHALNMDVIAEGVETEQQQEFLQVHGCNNYQGYLFSRPLPIEKLEVFLQSAWKNLRQF